MTITPEDLAVVNTRAHGRVCQLIADKFEEVTGVEMTDAQYGVLRSNMDEAIGEALAKACRV